MFPRIDQTNTFNLLQLAQLVDAQLINIDPQISSSVPVRVVDSTKLKLDNGLFVAICGDKVDSHKFVKQAFDLGALAAVVSDTNSLGTWPGLLVSDTRSALSKLAAHFYDRPSKKLSLIGITGTNGKTTTSWLVSHLLNLLGVKCSRLGTIGYSIGDLSGTSELTTPNAIALNQFLAFSLEQDCKAAVIEVSSHALDQARVQDLEFNMAVFTNLSRDHLDYHKDEQSYFQAKLRLFKLLSAQSTQSEPNEKSARVIISNLDNIHGEQIHTLYATLSGIRDLSFGYNKKAVLKIISFFQTQSGSSLELQYAGQNKIFNSAFIGEHNAENLAAAIAVCLAHGFNLTEISKVTKFIPVVPGRLENIISAPFSVVVDYAHTPDALQRVLIALRPITKGRLVVLFGCGGDRDKGKRPKMMRVCEQLADLVVVSSDNPRTEDPAQIIKEILSGQESAAKVLVESDRRKAIELAIKELEEGDTLLIAGKGHEDYQIVGQEKLHFSDHKEAKLALNKIMLSSYRC